MHWKNIIYMIVCLLIFAACKTQQKTSSSADQSAINRERVHWEDSIKMVVHEPADSMSYLEAVRINMHRTPKPYQYDTLSIIGVGDIMLGTNFPNDSYLPPNEGKEMLAQVADSLRSAHLTFGNQEGVILYEGGQQKNCSNPAVCYLFRSPEYMAQRLKDAGFDLLSLANNHAGDFGDEGRTNTIRVLDSLGIHHAGQAIRPFTHFEFDGLTIGFAAFSPNVGTIKINDYDKLKEILTHLDSISDIVIVSFHGGAEGAKYTHVTREREFFVGEDRGNVYEFAHLAIDYGADIVFGHGPHVPRAIEVYKERFIAYSLGNFATYGRFNLKGDNGLAPIVKLYTDRNGKFLHGRIISAKQVGAGIPEIDFTHAAALKIRELTEIDFPDTKILIDEVGNITYIQGQ